MIVSEDVLVIVRHDRLGGATGPYFLAADHERNLNALARHLLQARLELRAFR